MFGTRSNAPTTRGRRSIHPIRALTMSKAKKSKLEGPDEETRRQLARDIEAAGGIDNFEKSKLYALDELLNNPSKRQYYGDRGTARRKQIRNLVFRWKHWPREKYLERVILPFVIQSRPPPQTGNQFSDFEDLSLIHI